MVDGHVLAAALVGLAGLTAASPGACRPETFPFPAILGTRHVGTTAAAVRNYTGFPGFAHEATVVVPAASGVRPFCNVTVSYTHPGHDDVVSVHVWLPLEEGQWNGRFLGLGGGGFVVGDVDGDGPAAAVQEGYAAATTDGGHVAGEPPEKWALRGPGNLDWPLVVNFGHRSLHELAVVGKSATRAFYGGGGGGGGEGGEPRWSYWRGCSTGGRQGLALAQRYPGDFDGVLSVCPAVDFPAMVTSLYHPQLVMRRMGYWPSGCELAAVVAAGVEACDMTDGVADGIVGRLDGCVFDVRAAEGRPYVCDTDGDDGEKKKEERKVSRRAVEVVEAVMKGVVDEEGASMAPGYVPGAPLAGMFGMMNSVCEDEAERTTGCRGVTFAIAEDWIRLFVQKDAGFDVAGLTEGAFRDAFRRGVEEFESILGSGAPAPDLRRFRERGGKVLMWHGMADQAVPVEVTRGVYERARRLDAARGVDTAGYWRYFEVPGVNHCVSMGGAGGRAPAPFPWDAFERLRRWVEDGVAPEELEARRVVPAGEGTGARMVFEDEVRRVCRWPEEGVWDGEGWRCLKPGEKLAVAGEKDEL